MVVCEEGSEYGLAGVVASETADALAGSRHKPLVGGRTHAHGSVQAPGNTATVREILLAQVGNVLEFTDEPESAQYRQSRAHHDVT